MKLRKMSFPIFALCVGILVMCLAFPIGLYLQNFAYAMGYGTSGRFYWLISNLEWYLLIFGIIIGAGSSIMLLIRMRKSPSLITKNLE